MASCRRLWTGAAAAALGLVTTFALPSSAPAGAATEPATRYVARTLRVLEGTDPAERVESLASRIDGGTSRRTIVGEVVAGDAHQDETVAELFVDILDRAPSDADLDYWNDRLGVVGEYRVRAELLSSGEFLASVGGTKDAFVQAVYLYGLDREAEMAGVTYWVGRTGDTASSRSQVAWWVLRSAEGRSVVSRDLFEEILGRTPDAGGRQFYADRLTQAKGIERVTIDLASSSEAQSEAQKRDTLLVLLEGSSIQTTDAETLRSLGAPVTFADTTGTNVQLGITPGTDLVAIDVRPHTQVLYGLGSDGQLYSLSVQSVTASKIGAPLAGLAGDVVGFDFNPTVDRIRVTTAGGENYRLNPDTGAVAFTDTPLAYATGDRNEGTSPAVTGSGYTASARSSLGTPLPMSTALYDIDTGVDALALQSPPNDGTLTTVGKGLGVDIDGDVGFDISPDTGRAWAVGTDASDGETAAFRLDLASGRAIRQTTVQFDGVVLGAAIAPTNPVASGQGWALSSTEAGVHTVTSFALATPGTATATLTITGVTAGTVLAGIDVRSATGMAYVLGSDGQLYVLGAPKAATPTAVPAEKVGAPLANAANDGDAGFDFNPAVDRLRIVIGTRNLRVNPNTGALVDGDPMTDGVQEDGPLAYAAGDPNEMASPAVAGAAYTNAPRGGVAATTQLFDIEYSAGALVLQNPPNAGTLTTVGGGLGVTLATDGGFDIQTGSGTAYLVGTGATGVEVRVVSLAAGTTTLVGTAPALPDLVGFTTT